MYQLQNPIESHRLPGKAKAAKKETKKGPPIPDSMPKKPPKAMTLFMAANKGRSWSQGGASLVLECFGIVCHFERQFHRVMLTAAFSCEDLHEKLSGVLTNRMNQHGYGSIPINTIFSGMNIHLPAILM